MNTMNMPGFNADASLYRSGRCYLAVGNMPVQTAGPVEPQVSDACKSLGITSPLGCSVAGGAALGASLGAFGGTGASVIGGVIGAIFGALRCLFGGCDPD